MRYIFINHSNLTRIIILNIIEDFKLNKKDCIILNVRDQKKIKESKFNQPLTFFPYIEKYNYHRLIILGLAIILKLQILFLTRGKFTLYAPNYAVEFVRVISILANCVNKCQLEDGFVNYKYNLEQCKKLFYRKSKGRFKFLFDSSGLVHKNCTNYFCLDKTAFIGATSVFAVSRRILENFPSNVQTNEALNIFVLEPFSKEMTIEQYQKMIVKFLIFTNKGFSISYFKFHPEQSNKEIKKIKKYIESEKLNEIVYLTEPIEALLIKYSNVVIHSKISSLLIYQNIFTSTKGWCYEIFNNSNNDDLNIILKYAKLISI
jgi:hypothetical protein